jgi:hypothetical protein
VSKRLKVRAGSEQILGAPYPPTLVLGDVG